MADRRSLFQATCKMISYHGNKQTGVGTSFFVRYQNTLFLFTTYHQVVDSSHIKIMMLAENQNKRETLEISSEKFIKIVNMDLAMTDVTDLIKDSPNHKHLRIKAFVVDDNINYLDEIDLLDDIFFIGYPSGLIDTQNLTPLMRRCSFSSIYSEDFSGDPAFIIDGSVFPGSSGSPVFHVGEKISLLGIVSSSVVKQSNNETQYIDLGRAIKTKAIVAMIKAYKKGEFV